MVDKQTSGDTSQDLTRQLVLNRYRFRISYMSCPINLKFLIINDPGLLNVKVIN